MIHTRLILATVAGLFSVALGIFALLHNPGRRLNRSYAFLNFSLAFWTGAGWALFIDDPTLELVAYRFCYMMALPFLYYVLCFVQDFLDIYDVPSAQLVRRVTLLFVMILAPLHFTPLVIKSFVFQPNDPIIFTRISGPLTPVILGVIVSLFIGIAAVSTKHYLKASGVRKNRLKFLVFSLVLGVLGVSFRALSVFKIDLPLAYFFMQMGINFCFAYVIFKYQLFEFNSWMRRAVIYAGVYISLLSLPFFYLTAQPFLGPIFERVPSLVPFIIIVYAVLFSLAPALTAFLRDKAEGKRWADLRNHLTLVQEAARSLATETGLKIHDLSRQAIDLLEELYWRRLKTPLHFIIVVLRDKSGHVAANSHPKLPIDLEVLKQFLSRLEDSPEILNKPALNILDLEERVLIGDLKIYFQTNSIELCCPCVHDGKLRGALFLGPKQEGIFLPEEMTTLHMLASQIATAVRKGELLEMTQELHDLDQIKKDLISNITHEFKSPLNVVENAIDVLLDDVKDGRVEHAKVKDYLLMVRDSTERLEAFIQNMLEVARIEQSRIELKLGQVQLDQLIRKAVDHLAPLAAEKSLEIALSAAVPITLEADLEKIQQILINLISNAIKFTDSGRINVRVFSDNGDVRVEVQDTGTGIEPRYLDKVFDRFFQVPSVDGAKKGTGLGLAIAKGWAEAHGGRLTALSDGLGQGSTFVLEIPLRQHP